MYGSGKTEMGKNATNVLKVYDEKRKKLKEQYGERVVKQYIHSRYILINLNSLPRPSEIPTFSQALAYSLYASFRKYLDRKFLIPSVVEFLATKLNGIVDVINYFSEKYDEDSFFLHWDEVNNFLTLIK